jgi:integrase
MRHPDKIILKDGTVRYQLRVDCINPKTKRPGHRYERFTTINAANRRAAEVEHAKNTGDVVADAHKRFDTLLDEWLAASTVNLRRATCEDYKALAAKLRASPLGHKRIRAIKRTDIDSLRDSTLASVRAANIARVEARLAHDPQPPEIAAELRAKAETSGVGTATRMVLGARTVLKFAVDNGDLARNVATKVKRPARVEKEEGVVSESAILTPTEEARFLAFVPERHRMAVRFLFATGVRFGELLGLRRDDIEWATNRVFIRYQLCRHTGKFTKPKTEAGTRWIDLDSEFMSALKEHVRQNTIGVVSPIDRPNEVVFAIDRSNFRSRVWHPALRRAGLRSIRIHDARHTHASTLLAMGADVTAVAERLGHSNPSVTWKIYAHVLKRRAKGGLGEVVAAFKRQETDGCDLVVLPQRSGG